MGEGIIELVSAVQTVWDFPRVCRRFTPFTVEASLMIEDGAISLSSDLRLGAIALRASGDRKG